LTSLGKLTGVLIGGLALYYTGCLQKCPCKAPGDQVQSKKNALVNLVSRSIVWTFFEAPLVDDYDVCDILLFRSLLDLVKFLFIIITFEAFYSF
jgi:hypothetical protein